MFVRILWLLSYSLALLGLITFIMPRSELIASVVVFALVMSLVVFSAQALARRLPIAHCSGLSR